MSCGIYICMYVKMLLACGIDLSSCTTSSLVFRQEISNNLFSDCKKNLKTDRNFCPKCKDKSNHEWVECVRCKQQSIAYVLVSQCKKQHRQNISLANEKIQNAPY